MPNLQMLCLVIMLQIISGKFYDKDAITSEYKRQHPIYSNYSWVQPIKTCVADLVPSDYMGTYIINYVERMPKVGCMIATSGDDIIRQFKLFCVFGLGAYFDFEKENVELFCRAKPKHSGDTNIPSRYISRYFDSNINGTYSEVNEFCEFMYKVIGIPRRKYNTLISCIESYLHALQFINYNIDLAYSMFVYCLEALSQSCDDYEPTWSDYRKKDELDNIFKYIDDDTTVMAIKEVLLKDEFLKIQKRFISFIVDHVTEDYFCGEAACITNALRKTELEVAVKNAYGLRSRYTHELAKIHKQLKITHIALNDVFHWEKQPYLTINGLARLTYHVISNFIRKQDVLEKEAYDWISELPDTVELNVDPKHWIWMASTFKPCDADVYLSGFLDHLTSTNRSKEPLVDISDLMCKYEELFSSLSDASKKRAMLMVYYLFNSIVHEKDKRPNWEEVCNNNWHVFNECTALSLLMFLLTRQIWPWTEDDCIKVHKEYREKRLWKNELSLPLIYEVFIMCGIANMYLLIGNKDKYTDWLKMTQFELSGFLNAQNYLDKCLQEGRDIDIFTLNAHYCNVNEVE